MGSVGFVGNLAAFILEASVGPSIYASWGANFCR